MERTYVAIDLKSYYASVECTQLSLNPMTTNLVVADSGRTEKTICLAVTPGLKAYGISGRARLFDVVKRVKEINSERRKNAPGHKFSGSSCDITELAEHPELEFDYIIAKPRMALYKQISVQIYQIYLKYVSPDDIYPYSVDEVFIDITRYLESSGKTAREFTMTMILDVLETTGITATAGIGTNMFLCKVAMDIMAKHISPDKNGVRIAELDEMTYRKRFWTHRPLTDFWRIGKGYSNKLERNGIYTMGDIARCSVYNEDKLYKLFGVNAELLIDHAWGWEPCTVEAVKNYKAQSNSTSSGQVLQCPYTNEKAMLVVSEMAELSALDLVEKGLVTDQIVLDVGYDTENLKDTEIKKLYGGAVVTDHYGRKVPKPAHGTGNIGRYTSSTKIITDTVLDIFKRITDKNLMIRRLTLTANHLIGENEIPPDDGFEQMTLFTDYDAIEKERTAEREMLDREKRIQHAVLDIKKKFGKNAIIKGRDLQEGATLLDRNGMIGGHKA